MLKEMTVEGPAIAWRHMLGESKHVRYRGILAVLERAAVDNRFIAQLTDQGTEALAGYDLDWRERAALLSGDIRWIESCVGKLSDRLRTWLYCRLQQEKW